MTCTCMPNVADPFCPVDGDPPREPAGAVWRRAELPIPGRAIATLIVRSRWGIALILAGCVLLIVGAARSW